MTKIISVDEFIKSDVQAVFVRFHSAAVESGVFSGFSKMEFVGISLPEAKVEFACSASPEDAMKILLQKKEVKFICWHTGELYTMQRYFGTVNYPGPELTVNDDKESLDFLGDFSIEAVEWKLIQRFHGKGKTFEYLNLKVIVKDLFGEDFRAGFDLSEDESLLKTCQIARVVCARWIKFMGLQVPGFFFFEAPKPVKKVAPPPPVLKKV